MPSKGNSETHNDSAHASINTEASTKQSDNPASDGTKAASNKGKSTQKTIDFSKLFADDLERNQKISITAIRILIFIACILYFEIRASIIHFEEVQKLIKAPENTPNEILETINEIRNTFSFLSLILIILVITFVSCFIKIIMDFLDKYPQRVFVVTVSLGGVLAFSIPQYLYSFKFIGETKDITTSLLTVTGGILAVFTLLKTHQKSELEREQLDTQKEKDQRDHDRQVHAERRSRYAKAIEQLADEKAAIRLGGIYTLVGLVDEWLTDKDIKDINIRHEEGQVIINNLCAYIRSPFPLAQKADTLEIKDEDRSYGKGISGQGFFADQAAFREEQNIRQTIFNEMDKRSSDVIKDREGKITVTPGTWSVFDFNFTSAPIFYSLNNLTIEKGNFSEANFYGNQNFKNVKFAQDADFSGAEFNKFAADFKVKFSSAIFAQKAIFSDSTFENEADFLSATFGGRAEFNGTIFKDDAIFSAATFTGFASLSASFEGEAKFRQVTFKGATFSGSTFNRDADFSGNTTFGGIVNFMGTPFKQDVFFDKVTFENKVSFSGATFTQNARFVKATFTQKTDFSYATFENYEPLFESNEERAKFSIRPSQEDYIFSVSSSSKPLHTNIANLDDITRRIPVGAVLFDPTSPKDKNGNYRESAPAKYPSTPMIPLKFSSKDTNT